LKSIIAKFESIVNQITDIGRDLHSKNILDHARWNLPYVEKSIRDLPELPFEKRASAIVISAGPSVHKRNSIQRIKQSAYKGTIIVVDGAYIASLKQGLIPDFVLTLDPHPTRIVRWFGDSNFEENNKHDDYFQRQDLDLEFRKNTIQQNQYHIQLVNQYGFQTKAIVASTAPQNVVRRIYEAQFDRYWWNPLVDDPNSEKSLTRQLYDLNKLPCMNTGGTVGTAAWVFAHSILTIPKIAVLGMDFGYYADTPFKKTQTYYELVKHIGQEEDVQECFMEMEFPLTKEKFFIDPTYFWYRRNFLQLLAKSRAKIFNCTEGGTLFGDQIECISLSEFLNHHT